MDKTQREKRVLKKECWWHSSYKSENEEAMFRSVSALTWQTFVLYLHWVNGLCMLPEGVSQNALLSIAEVSYNTKRKISPAFVSVPHDLQCGQMVLWKIKHKERLRRNRTKPDILYFNFFSHNYLLFLLSPSRCLLPHKVVFHKSSRYNQWLTQLSCSIPHVSKTRLFSFLKMMTNGWRKGKIILNLAWFALASHSALEIKSCFECC